MWQLGWQRRKTKACAQTDPLLGERCMEVEGLDTQFLAIIPMQGPDGKVSGVGWRPALRLKMVVVNLTVWTVFHLSLGGRGRPKSYSLRGEWPSQTGLALPLAHCVTLASDKPLWPQQPPRTVGNVTSPAGLLRGLGEYTCTRGAPLGARCKGYLSCHRNRDHLDLSTWTFIIFSATRRDKAFRKQSSAIISR